MQKKRFTYYSFFVIISLTIVLSLTTHSCSSSHKAVSTKWNLAAIYNPSRTNIHPAYKIYHDSPTSSLLYLKIFTHELLFQPVGKIGNNVCEIKVSYSLYETNDESKSIADSGSYNYTIPEKTTGAYYINQIPIKTDTGKSYKLKITIKDLFRRTSNLSFIDIEKNEDYGQQYFNITNKEGIPVFKNILIGNAPFLLKHANPKSDSLYIKYYFNDVRLPKSTFSMEPDETSYKKYDSLYILPYNPEQELVLVHEGLYYIQFDTNTNEGISISKFNRNFPKVKTEQDMLEPLAYLITTGEYKTLSESENLKMAIDNFWINAGGSTSRGREMIRIFYNRVFFANYYFSNTKPGWKTDRGMIYIVYGAPHSLKKNSDSEIWYYYRKGSGESITFTFSYKPSKFHLNNYTLNRSENHSWHWKEAVYSWTHGEIFLLD